MYSKTAFDSRYQEFSSYEKTDFKHSKMIPRKKKLNTTLLKVPITDYAFTSNMLELDCLRDRNLDKLELNHHRYHYGFSTCIMSKGKGCFLLTVAYIILMLGVTVVLANFFDDLTLTLSETVFVICAVLQFKMYLYYYSTIDDDSLYPTPEDTRFDRFTGMLLLNENNKKIEIPFNEMDVYFYSVPGGTMHLPNYVMLLIHRFSNNVYNLGTSPSMHLAIGKLSYLYRFMDTSKPLPNLPLLVTDRYNDPRTAEVEDSSILSREDWEKLTNDNWTNQRIKSEKNLKVAYGL